MSIQKIIYLLLTVFILYLFFTIGFPFLIAFLIALMLEPLIQMMNKILKGNRVISVALVCSCFTILIFGIGYLVIIKGIEEGMTLSRTIISFIQENYEELTQFSGRTQSWLSYLAKQLHLEISDLAQTGVDFAQTFLGTVSEYLFVFVKAIPQLVLDFLIFIIALYLISFVLPTLKIKILNAFDQSTHHKIELVMQKLYGAVFGFIRAQLIISFFIFIITLIGLLILGVPYSIVIATLITVVDILPIMGTGSVLIPMSIYYLFIGNYFIGFGLLILYGSLIALRRIIEPKILGDAIGIGALAALASMYIGFNLTGIIGLFLGPATIILLQALINAEILNIKIKF